MLSAIRRRACAYQDARPSARRRFSTLAPPSPRAGTAAPDSAASELTLDQLLRLPLVVPWIPQSGTADEPISQHLHNEQAFSMVRSVTTSDDQDLKGTPSRCPSPLVAPVRSRKNHLLFVQADQGITEILQVEERRRRFHGTSVVQCACPPVPAPVGVRLQQSSGQRIAQRDEPRSHGRENHADHNSHELAVWMPWTRQSKAHPRRDGRRLLPGAGPLAHGVLIPFVRPVVS